MTERKLTRHAGAGLALAITLLLAHTAGAEQGAGDAKLDLLYPHFAARSGGPYNTGHTVTSTLVYDSGRDVLVRFGGLGEPLGIPLTSEWDGEKWIGVDCADVPSPSGGYQMVYDAARGEVVLFGGYPAANETWVYDGTNWTKKNPANVPPARWGHAMAYDEANQVVVMFGGTADDVSALGDTWTWDGTDWTDESSSGPAPRKDHAMAYDAVGGVVVLLRGKEYMELIPGWWVWGALSDMWAWDGASWAELTPATLPPAAKCLAYDPNISRLVLFDNLDAASFDLWVYDSGDWSSMTYGTSPEAPGVNLSYGPGGGAYFLAVPVAIQKRGDPPFTWQWDGAAWSCLTAFARKTMGSPVWPDVNGDGERDLIAAGQVIRPADGALGMGKGLLLRSGAGVAEPAAWTHYQGTYYSAAAVGDVNGDGADDVAFGYFGARIQLFTNSAGTLPQTPDWTSAANENPTGLAFVDVDGDGYDDLAVLFNDTPDGIKVFLNTGGILETNASLFFGIPDSGDGYAASAGSFAWADIDGDGAEEAALGFSYSSSSTEAGPHIAIIDFAGGVLVETDRISGYSGPLEFGDIDGDGDFDLVGATFALPGEAGSVGATPIWETPPLSTYSYPASVDLADYDGDGDLDLAVAYHDSGTTSPGHVLYRNDGGVLSGGPVWRSREGVGTDAQAGESVALIDFNSDGILDVATDKGVYFLSAVLRDTVPPSPPRWQVGRSGTPTNRDITLEWTASASADVAAYRIYEGMTDLTRVFVTEVDATSLQTVISSPPEGWRNYLISAVDEAGNEGDVLAFDEVGSLPASSVTGDAKPDFSTPGSYTLVGDLDGDTDADIFTAVWHDGPDEDDWSWEVHINDGWADFTLGWSLGWTGDPGKPVSLGDATGDSLPDLLSLDRREVDVGGGNMEWRYCLDLYANTGGSFSTTPSWTLVLPADASGPVGFAWGDPDGDLDLDLALAGVGPNGEAALYLNDGTSMATSAAWTSTVQDVKAVAFGNVNGDGRDDLAINEDVGGQGTSSSLKAYVFYGQAGGLPAAATWSKDEGNVGRATGLSWADFDGDGDADLTVISNWAAYLYVNSAGTLETDTLQQYFGSGTAAEGLIGWADVNGDNDLDLYGKESVMLAGPASFPGPIGEGAAYNINGLDNIIEEPWRRQSSMIARVTHAADFNGDGAADLLTGYVNFVFLQQPASFPPSVGPSVDSIEVSPAGPLTLTGAGASQAFTVTATYSDLSTADVTASASFSVSSSMNDGTLIVRMTGNVAEAVNAGEASVRVSYLSRSAALKVYVVAVDPVPVSIAVSPAAATLTREGETLTYTVAATLDNGETVDVTADSTIGSSDGAVATVSGDTATALASGTATLTATYGALSDTASLEVAIAATLDSISVSPATAGIEVGERQGLEVTAHFSDGSTQTVTPFAVLTSSDPAVASVDGFGVVGEAVGSATVTADYLGRSAPATVNVSARTGTQFSLSASSHTVSEATGSLQVTVRRIGDGVGATSVIVSTRDGSAAAPGDYTAITSQTLNWAAGNTDDQAVTVTVTSDAVSEPEEVFHVALSSPVGGVLAPPFSAEVHVFDAPQEGTISLSDSSYVVGEGATYVEVTVSRTGGTDGGLTVDYTTSDGDAAAGADYTGVTGSLTWGDGDAADQVVQIAILDDLAVEGDEVFDFFLSNPTAGSLGTAAAAITILDDDSYGNLSFSASDYQVAENGVTVTVVVRRQGGVSGDVTVDYATSDGSASAGDYASAAGTLQWLEGDSADKTFDVTLTDDILVEFDETVNVTLLSPTGGATLGALATATVTILDDEVNTAPVSDAGTDQSVQESDTVYLDGTGSYDPDSGPGALTFSWQQTSGTAVTLTDAQTASPSFTAPNVAPPSEVLTFELTVSDGELSATDPIAVTVADTPPGTTRSAGGCTFGLTRPGGSLLACLLLAALVSLFRRRCPRAARYVPDHAAGKGRHRLN